jgi:hypothetical protein
VTAPSSSQGRPWPVPPIHSRASHPPPNKEIWVSSSLPSLQVEAASTFPFPGTENHKPGAVWNPVVLHD